MVWSMTNPKNGKLMYLKRAGHIVMLTYDKHKAIQSIPDGWDVIKHNNQLKLIRRG